MLGPQPPRPQPSGFQGLVIALGFAFAFSACTKPPTRSFIVNLASSNAEPETEGNATDTSGDATTDTSTDSESSGSTSETGTKPSSDTDTKGETETSTTPETTETTTEEPAKITECTNKLSVGRIHQWHATYEGTMIPQEGLIVVKEGTQNVAKVEFVGEGWHVVPVWLKNVFDGEVDLSKSKNFVITYSATADLYMQLRPADHWDGGDKWAAKIPSTGGESKTLTVSFEDAASWTAPLGQPSHTLNEARARARGFVFVGNKPAKFAVTALVIDGYTPPCE